MLVFSNCWKDHCGGGGDLVAKSCLTLCDSMNCSPPGSSVHGILQARILEWIAISFSRGSSWLRNQTRSPALQADSLLTELWGKPISFFRASSWPRDWACVSCIGRQILNQWTTREISVPHVTPVCYCNSRLVITDISCVQPHCILLWTHTAYLFLPALERA